MSDSYVPEDLNRRGLERAAEAMCSHGREVYLPWQGTMDDLEWEHFKGMCAAIRAYLDARDAP